MASSGLGTAPIPPDSANFPSNLSPLDADPQTPLHQRSPMPRAPPSPITQDPMFPMEGTSLANASPPTPPSALALPGQQFPMSIFDVNILTYIKFTVDSSGKNFTRWRKIILFLLQLYRARDHVENGGAYRTASDAWRQEDGQIVLWFYATVSEALQDILLDPDCTAYTAWQCLHTFFYDNREGQAMQLNQDLRDTPRGDLSIGEYCGRLKHIANQLEEVGAPITDRALTMQLIDGLGEKFKMQAEILANTVPYPTLWSPMVVAVAAAMAVTTAVAAARTAIGLAKVKAAAGAATGPAKDKVKVKATAAAAAAAAPHGGYPGGVSPNYKGKNPIPGYQPGAGRNGQQQQGGGGGSGGRGRGSGQNSNAGGGPLGFQGGSSAQPWMGYFAPWGTPFPPARAPWVPPNSSSVLGPRPGSHDHAYPVHYSASPYMPPPPYSWDHASMVNQATSYGSAFQPRPDWLMDSGASSHVTGNQGVNVVTGKWIFRHKLNPDGTLARYKARWVVRGFT
ncbi:hypothetical protein ACQ4PT_061674 [Festuca glaucescens]